MTILGYPFQELFLFFFFYSFLGWLMETCYCSLREQHFVARGFLHGPLCPIYGCGVLLMILFFTPLKRNLVLFYVTAVVVMTSWEYFVGWLLETTTHVKYWDYSHSKFNIKGRVCLWVALTWGLLSYAVIFWIHPPVESLYAHIPLWLVNTLCGVLGAVLVADAVITIRELALMSRIVTAMTKAKDELQLQLSLGKAEFTDKLDNSGEELKKRYREQMARLERYTRRYRRRYSGMRFSERYPISMEDIRAAGALAREELLRRRDARRAQKKH